MKIKTNVRAGFKARA